MVFSEEGSIVAGTASKMKLGILLLAQILCDREAELTKKCKMSPELQVSSRRPAAVMHVLEFHAGLSNGNRYAKALFIEDSSR
jgi:hypothetical protein